MNSFEDSLPKGRHLLTRELPNLAADEIWCEYDVSQDGERFGQIRSWTVLLELAATEMAKAIGSHLGEAMAQKLVDSLFGIGNDSDYEQEVLARLQRIESKLDSLIDYLKRDFPRVVERIVQAEFASATRKQLRTSALSVQNELRNFRHRNSPETARDLRASAIEVAKLSHNLLQYGPGLYSAAMHAMGSFLSAMSALIRYDSLKYSGDLAFWARQHLLLAEPFINELVPDSLTTARIAGATRLEGAQKVRATLPATFLVAIYGPQVKYTPTTDIYQIYANRLHSWNGDVWQGDQPRRPRQVPTGSVPSPQELISGFADNVVILQWWQPRIQSTSHPHDLFLESVNHANVQCRFAESFPPILDRLVADERCCTQFVQSLKAMARLG